MKETILTRHNLVMETKLVELYHELSDNKDKLMKGDGQSHPHAYFIDPIAKVASILEHHRLRMKFEQPTTRI